SRSRSHQCVGSKAQQRSGGAATGRRASKEACGRGAGRETPPQPGTAGVFKSLAVAQLSCTSIQGKGARAGEYVLECRESFRRYGFALARPSGTAGESFRRVFRRSARRFLGAFARISFLRCAVAPPVQSGPSARALTIPWQAPYPLR